MVYSNNCLIDYIGLLGCSTTTPKSGIYVNSLPGISLKNVDQIADSEQVTFAGVWSDVQLRATRKLFTDIRAEFAKKYKLNNIVDAVDIGDRLDTTITTAPAAQYRGVFIDLDNFEAQHDVVSNFQQFNIQTIKIYLSGAITPAVKIFDALSGTLLKTVSFTGGVAGWNTIDVYEKFTARRIFVCYDATLLTSTNLNVEQNYCHECGSTVMGGYSSIASSVKKSNITLDNDTFGLSVQYDVQCSFDSFICNHKEIFTNALWYLLGSELMMEAQYSDRVSFITTINAQKVKELKAELFNEYTSELSQAIDGIQLNLSDCCLECNEQVILKEFTP